MINNVNFLCFDATNVLEQFLFQGHIDQLHRHRPEHRLRVPAAPLRERLDPDRRLGPDPRPGVPRHLQQLQPTDQLGPVGGFLRHQPAVLIARVEPRYRPRAMYVLISLPRSHGNESSYYVWIHRRPGCSAIRMPDAVACYHLAARAIPAPVEEPCGRRGRHRHATWRSRVPSAASRTASRGSTATRRALPGDR